jgi:hypothetical protein
MSYKMYIVIRHMCTDSLNCFLGEKQNPSGIGGVGGWIEGHSLIAVKTMKSRWILDLCESEPA